MSIEFIELTVYMYVLLRSIPEFKVLFNASTKKKKKFHSVVTGNSWVERIKQNKTYQLAKTHFCQASSIT